MSCADVQTIKAGDGSKLQFSFDFPYIFKSEIHVYLWNATTKEWDEKLTTDATYPWQVTDANPTIVEFTSTAPPAPAAAVDPNEETVDNVKIRRITNLEDIRALFNPGSAIRSDDLNNNFEQLRYAIQESNCQGVTDDVYQYLLDNYWDRFDNTVYSTETWRSDNATIATTAAMDARFQDEATETITSSETWANDDDTIATTAAIDDRIDTAITNDIGTDGTGITVTDDGDGTITLGLDDNSIDFSKLKDVDIITYAEQNAGSPSAADTNLFTASAAARRFDTLVQTATPSGTNWEVGKTWLQNDADKTLSVWDGDSWEGISSGGTFTSQSRVIYVDPVNGNDDNDGHRISRPKATIKDAIADINADDDFGDGSVVVVAPGVYQEAAPIQIQRRDVSIVGTSLRSCIVHPTQATETNNLFEVNSGTYLQNLTFTGVKASGTRGESGSLYPDSTYGLPATQGWNIAFLAGATIVKSPYIQNCTNFSDSEIDNTDLDFFAGTEDKGRAGDEDSAMTGGGILIDGSVPAATSPLRSMVCDSYTHVGLDGPGILVTNNGYLQATSSYAFFNHFHIACINGGQANLAASTTDFGEYSLIADGKSPNPVLTSTVDGAASDGATSFNIDAATGSTDLYNESGTENDNAWFGSATRPAPNMLVEVNSVIYPITSVTANGSGWTINISRPDPNNRSNNLGLDGAISDAATVNFYLRSMIASSGHTMEYVGSGTNYSALPENGGVPNEARQITELNDGKIWTVITDHNGKFKIGGNQTDDPIFEVDQQLGFVTIPEGSIAFNLLSDTTPQLGGDLDVNGQSIVSTSNGDINITPDGTGLINLNGSTSVDGSFGVTSDSIFGDQLFLENGTATDPILAWGTTNQDTGIYSPGEDQLAISTAGNGRLFVDSSGRVGIGTNDPGSFSSGGGEQLVISNSGDCGITVHAGTSSLSRYLFADGTGAASYRGFAAYEHSTDSLRIGTASTDRVRIDSAGRVGIGTSSPNDKLEVAGAILTTAPLQSHQTSMGVFEFNNNVTSIRSYGSTAGTGQISFSTGGGGGSSDSPAMRIDSSGRVGIGTTSPASALDVGGAGSTAASFVTNPKLGIAGDVFFEPGSGNDVQIFNYRTTGLAFGVGGAEKARIDSSGRLLVGTSSSSLEKLVINGGGGGIQISRDNSNRPVAGETLGSIGFKATVDGTLNTKADVLIQGVANQDHNSNLAGSRLEFHTKANGTAPGDSPTERVRIEAGGRTKFSGAVYGIETTITAGTGGMDLNDSNFWTCAGITIPLPTNGVAGMSGLIRVTAAPTFATGWDFPGGTYTAPTAFPAIAPFYIVDSSTFLLGNWTEGIA